MQVGAPVPSICGLQGDIPTDKKQPADVVFKVRLVEPGCTSQTCSVAAKDMVSHFGRPWCCSMLADFAVELAHHACNPGHSLHRFCKEQLLLVAFIARQAKFKLEEVFGKAMLLEDGTAKRKDQVLGPKLKELLQLSNKIHVPLNAQDQETSPSSERPLLQAPQQPQFDFRRRDPFVKYKEQPVKENRSKLRKVKAILDRDDRVMALIKKGGIKGLSIKNTRLQDMPNLPEEMDSSLGKRQDHQGDSPDSHQTDTDSEEQCARLHH